MREDPLSGDPGEGGLHHVVGARVAVVVRVGEQDVAPAQQPEVDAPGVDADAVQLGAVSLGAEPQSLFHLGEQAQHVPVETVEQLHGAIGKAVQVLQFEAFAVELPENGAAALRAQVEGQEFPFSCSHLFSSLATGSSVRVRRPVPG